MTRSSYTASERRGMLAIALIALMIMGGGICMTLWNKSEAETEKPPVVIEYAEVIDSVSLKEKEGKVTGKTSSRTKSTTKKSKNKNKKTYRRRSPLDEPV